MTSSFEDLDQQAGGVLDACKRFLIGEKVREGGMCFTQAGLDALDRHESLELGVDA